MCPTCIADAAVMAAGAAGAGGILTLCIGSFRKWLEASGLSRFNTKTER
jgi:hypothetical protein